MKLQFAFQFKQNAASWPRKNITEPSGSALRKLD